MRWTLFCPYPQCAVFPQDFLGRVLYPGWFPSWQICLPLISALLTEYKDSFGGQGLLELLAWREIVFFRVYPCLDILSELLAVGPPQAGLFPFGQSLAPLEQTVFRLCLLGVDPSETGCPSLVLFDAGPLRKYYPPPAPNPSGLAVSFHLAKAEDLPVVHPPLAV